MGRGVGEGRKEGGRVFNVFVFVRGSSGWSFMRLELRRFFNIGFLWYLFYYNVIIC